MSRKTHSFIFVSVKDVDSTLLRHAPNVAWKNMESPDKVNSRKAYCIDELQNLFNKVCPDTVKDSRHIQYTCVIQDRLKEKKDFWKETFDLKIEDLCSIISEEEGNQKSIREDCQGVADEIHRIADSLPQYGAILDVYLWPLKDKTDRNQDGYIQYLGALRRLKDWHNAKFTILEAEPTADTEFLQRFLSSDVFVQVDDVQIETEHCLWRGKVSVCNKIENTGLIVPGVCMYTSDSKSEALHFPLRMNNTNCKLQTLQKGQLGRMLEVLDEISLSSVSSMLKTPYTYRICLYQKHPYSQVLLNYIRENDNTGLLARIPIYPGDKAPVTCSETNLSSAMWKENIVTDLQFVQEPDEDLQDDFEFLYFVITSPDKNSAVDNHVAVAYQLQHPYYLDGSLLTTIYHNALVNNEDEKSEGIDLSGLPVMSCDMLMEAEIDLLLLRKQMLQKWITEKQKKGESSIVPVSELKTRLRDLQMTYLSKMAEKLPKYQQTSSCLKINLEKNITEISENSYDWLERQIQQYEESQRRSLSRLQSSESVAMSSPVQPSEVSSTIDIQSFLKFFHPDGSATNESLSPVRRRHPSRAQSKIVHPDTSSPTIMSWPESKDTLSHDIYYNVDKKSEKVNNHLNKVREKFIRDETYSSSSSPVILFPRYDRNKGTSKTHQQEVRRSPRKRSSKFQCDENIPVTLAEKRQNRTKLTRLSDNFQHLAPVPEKSKRRYSIAQAPPTQDHVTQEHSKRRKSEVSRKSDLETSSKPVEQPQSDSKHLPEEETVKKESRSERHKRRLQEIVDSVLLKHGVDRSDQIFKSCSARLFKVTKLFVMDLPNSRNLKDEMRKIAESQVQHVIDADRSRMKTS